MECITFDGELAHLVVADPDPFLVGLLVERTFDLQSSLGRGVGDQLDHCGAALQRLPPPMIWQNARCSILFHCVLQKEAKKRSDNPRITSKLIER